MNLELKRPLCFFDLESTGLDVAKERIVSIAITKIMPDKSIEKKKAMINPTIPIPKESSDIHGITDEMVKDKPTFKQLSKGLYEFIKNSDLGGYYNNEYDNALLQEEFLRCDIDFPQIDTNSVDACFIFKKFERRDLSAALRFYCNEEMQNAHNSEFDTEATVKIFVAQLERYDELKGKSIEEISKMCNPKNRADWQGKIIRDVNGDYVYNFGGSKGKRVKDDLGFAYWVLTKDFPESLKTLLRKITKEISIEIAKSK